MKKSIRAVACILAAMTLLTACKKDKAKSKTELLTSGNWKIVSDMSKVGSGAWTENIGGYDDCDKDDFIKFNTNNTYVADEGASKCDPSDDQSYTGTWAFENGEAKINVDGSSADIEELSESTLTVSGSEVDGSDTYYYKQVYKH